MARLSAVGAIRRLTPPWLRRTVGAQVMEGIAEVVDDTAERFVQGVKLRFPGVPPRPIDADALALTGRERRIRRGPLEPEATYAARLPSWWDAHRTRGGPYALLEQLFAYWRDALGVRMDVVYHSGTRRWIDPAGVITRDAITWGADGSSNWARIWVFFHLGDVLDTVDVTDHLGDPILDDGDDPILARTGSLIVGGAVSDEDAENFKAIPREWSAAHVQRTTIVLLWGEARLWGYPQPVPAWGAWTWQGATTNPVVLVVED